MFIPVIGKMLTCSDELYRICVVLDYYSRSLERSLFWRIVSVSQSTKNKIKAQNITNGDNCVKIAAV
jgi:hypothetical protein